MPIPEEVVLALSLRLGIPITKEQVVDAVERMVPPITATDRARFCGCGHPEQHEDGNP